MLPPKWVCRGVFFSITKTINSSIIRLISVTHEQGSMPVKHNAFLINKLHPSDYSDHILRDNLPVWVSVRLRNEDFSVS